jgi:hypothetical protein
MENYSNKKFTLKSAIYLAIGLGGMYFFLFVVGPFKQSKSYDSLSTIENMVLRKSKSEVVQTLGSPSSDREEVMVYWDLYLDKSTGLYCDVFIYHSPLSGVYRITYGNCTK